VRLPVQLQRAMAAEAEATREAKAKVGKTDLCFHMGNCPTAVIKVHGGTTLNTRALFLQFSIICDSI